MAKLLFLFKQYRYLFIPLAMFIIGVLYWAIMYSSAPVLDSSPCLATDPTVKDGLPLASTVNTVSSEILFHIDGAVKTPGVYKVATINFYLYQAIQLAGGLLQNADISRVNLASEVKHGQKVIVPFAAERNAYTGSKARSATAAGESLEPCDINLITLQELSVLKGIGPALATRIIEYREQNGYFTSLEQLRKVKGVGEKKLKMLEKLISI